MKAACNGKVVPIGLAPVTRNNKGRQALSEVNGTGKGDRGKALSGAFRAYWDELCAYVRKTFGAGPPDPEDVVQEAFARLAAMDDPAKIDNPRAFLYTTTRNLVIDHKRRRGTVESYVDAVLHRAGEDMPGALDLETQMIQSQTVELLQQAIDRMPAKQRTALLLNRLHGESYRQIEGKIGWSRSEICRQMAKAVSILSKAISDGKGRDER